MVDSAAGASSGDRSSTREFLQSAIVLDDQAYSVGTTSVGTLAEPPNGPGRRALSGEAREAVEPEVGHRERDLDIQSLTDGFADAGIVCGVLCPKVGEAEIEATRLLGIAVRADIVILDWQINGDDGAAALGIISQLAVAEANRSALKLVCIYTADRTNINQIIKRVVNGVRDKLAPPTNLVVVSDYEIDFGALKVLLYSKVRLEIPDEELASRYASEADLPARLLTEFDKMTGGLLQSVAIRALTALRKNTHLIAARFSPQLDAGYLWHRGSLPRPDDAEDHIREVLASEFESILDASDSTNAAAGPECEDVIARLSEPLKARFGIEEDVTFGDINAIVHHKGELGAVSKRIRKKLKKRPQLDQIAAFSGDAASAVRANERFAMMMTLRTLYGETSRHLQLGTVLRSEEAPKPRYLICLQPLCDSARILGPRPFPLIPIELVNAGTFNLVVPLSATENGHFLVKFNQYLLEMREFSVAGTVERPVAAVKEGQAWIFTDSAQHKYTWLAELRTGVAHLFAQKVANQFSRIGLDMPEYLRD